MAFNFTLAVSIPGTVSGPIATTLISAVRNALGEDAEGLTPKQAGELFCRRALRVEYDKERKRTTTADATASARAEIDGWRVNITTNEASVKITEAAAQAQSESDWA